MKITIMKSPRTYQTGNKSQYLLPSRPTATQSPECFQTQPRANHIYLTQFFQNVGKKKLCVVQKTPYFLCLYKYLS